MEIINEVEGVRLRIDRLEQSLTALIEELRQAQADFHGAKGSRIRHLEKKIDAAIGGRPLRCWMSAAAVDGCHANCSRT